MSAVHRLIPDPPRSQTIFKTEAAQKSQWTLTSGQLPLLSRVAGVIAAFLVAAAVLVICDMVIERYLLNRSTIWQIDVVTYCIVSATFVGSAYVLMTRGHVNVDVLPLHLAPRPRYWLALCSRS